MSTAPDFLFVSEHTARHPVARAIAKQKLHGALRDFKIRLYMLQDGEAVPIDCQAAAKVLAVAVAALDIMEKGNDLSAKIITGGMGALTDIARTGWIWRTRHAIAVDEALKHAQMVYAVAPATVTQAAHLRVVRMEEGVEGEGGNVGGEARLAAHQPSHTTTATPQGVASTDQLGGRFRSEMT